jgi:glycosyltransferase involved in cell wall biosynthesis
MKISVLIAAHQSDRHIAESLASLQLQRHPDWELMVVEYGLPDNTRALVESFAGVTGRPVTHLHLGENHGAASARNRLLEMATGDWVAFLDPGDRWTSHHLTNAAVRLVAEFDIVASDVRLERGAQLDDDLSPSPQLAINAVRTLFVGDALPVISAVAFRRAFARRAGFFDTQFRAGEARDFWLRCALHGARFAATQRVTCRSPRSLEPDHAHLLLVADQRVQFYEKHRDIASIPAALRRRLLSASLVAKGRLLRVSDPASAAQYYLRAWSLQPMHVQTLGQLALLGSRFHSVASAAEPDGPSPFS